MAVPNIFATATTTIPLSQLDANFATAITLGNTATYLGNTTTSIGNLTLTGAVVNGTVGATTPSTGAFTTISTSGLVTANINGGTLPASVSGETIRTAGANGSGNRFLSDSFGGAPIITFRRANTSSAAPSAVQSGDNLAFLSVLGYGATAYNGNISAALFASATENWTDSAIGSKWTIQAAPTGSTTRSTIAVFDPNSGVSVTGTINPSADNTYSCGTGALRWSVVYAATGTINTSDAREKTAIYSMSDAEINAAKQLAKEIGTYKWLESVAKKGDAARKHIGFTVQKAIEIMQENGLDPMAYGFICYDQWEDKFEKNSLDEFGAVSTKQVQKAGDRYSFRYDELNMFLARGFEARIAALEAK